MITYFSLTVSTIDTVANIFFLESLELFYIHFESFSNLPDMQAILRPTV